MNHQTLVYMHRFSLFAALTAILVFFPIQAFAQFYADSDQKPGFFVSATTTSTGLGAGLVVLSVAEMNRTPESIHAFLKNNAVELKKEFALGAGEKISDLAQLLHLREKDISLFSLAMRKNKNLFKTLIEQKTPLKKIVAFMQWAHTKFPNSHAS